MRKFYIYVPVGDQLKSTVIIAKEFAVAVGANNTGQSVFYGEKGEVCGVAPVNAIVVEMQ